MVLFLVLGGRQLIGRKVAVEAPAEAEHAARHGGAGARRGTRSGGRRPDDRDDGTMAAPGAAPRAPAAGDARPDPDADRPGRRRRPGAGVRPRHRLRLHQRRHRPGAVRRQPAQGRGQPDQLVDRAAHRRRAHVRVRAAGGRHDRLRRRGGDRARRARCSIALLLCYIGGVVSAFASSTAIIGVAIALAVPFLQAGDIGAVGVVVALSVASTIVDVSPFSTNGALVLANAQDVDKDRFYKQILGYTGDRRRRRTVARLAGVRRRPAGCDRSESAP